MVIAARALLLWAALCVRMVGAGAGGAGDDEREYGRILARKRSACQGVGGGSFPVVPYCDLTLSAGARAVDLVARLGLEEKARLLGSTVKGVGRLGLPKYEWWNEALHGVADSPGVRWSGRVRSATAFPQVSVTAASLNRTLWALVGSAAGTEARAMYNAGQAGLTFWSPNVNLFRDPRWGRGQETPGEDPVVNSEYGVAFVTGFQEDARDPSRLKASACCKHFAAYSLEKGRMSFDAVVSARDLHESYLPMFEACVRRGRVSSLMCSYNAMNGVPACVHKGLLQDTARDAWGFDGYVVSDCRATQNAYSKFRWGTRSEVVRDSLRASVDVSCADQFLQRNTPKAVALGFVEEALVDRAVANLFKVQIRLGMFDPASAQPLAQLGRESVNTPEHQQLALDAARQGVVLLKNAGGLLPLDLNLGSGLGSGSGSGRGSRAATLAVIGPLAADRRAQLGNYAGRPPLIVSVLAGLKKRAGKVRFTRGCSLSPKASAAKQEKSIARAERVARAADQAVLVVGAGQGVEAEYIDRESLLWPSAQPELVRRVAAAVLAAGRPPVVVVAVAAGAVDLSWELASDGVGAIVWAGYGGMYGGRAAAEVLFGDTNPSGRLTQTFYPQAFAQSVPMTDMRMTPDESRGYPGRGYRFYSGDVVLPFGYGLSFTSFRTTLASKATTTDKATGKKTTVVDVDVANAGPRPGATVVLAFLCPPALAAERGLHGHLRRRLLSFPVRTPELAPGASFRATFQVHHAEDLLLFTGDDQVHPEPIKLQRKNGDDATSWSLEIGGHDPVRAPALVVSLA